MVDMYAFMGEARPVEKIKSHAKILAVIAKQTTECAYFIQKYAETKGFGMSFVVSDKLAYLRYFIHQLFARSSTVCRL
jgi:hypothetical protein